MNIREYIPDGLISDRRTLVNYFQKINLDSNSDDHTTQFKKTKVRKLTSEDWGKIVHETNTVNFNLI